MIWMLGSPLIGMVSSVAKGAGSIASGVAKGIGKAVSGTEKEAEMSANAGNGGTTPAINTKGAPVNFEEESPVSDMFGGLDLAKVKSALDDEGPMGPPEPEAPTVYKRMIAVLKTMSETLLRMENTMKMLLAIEYERVKGMVAQSTAENITLAQTDDDDDGEKRGLFGRGKDMLGGAWKKAKDSPKWLKMLGLAGLLAAINFWKEDLEKAVAKLLEWFTKAYEYFTADDFSWDKLKTDFTTKFIPKIKEFIWGVLDWIWGAIKGVATEWLFGASGDKVIKQQADTGAQSKQNAASIAAKMTGDATYNTYDDKITGAEGLTEKETDFLSGEVTSTLAAMSKISKESDGRIAWTGMNDLTDFVQGGILRNYTPSQILNANPVIDGVEYPDWEVLKNINLNRMGGITRTMTDEKQKEIKGLLAEKTRLYQDFAEWSRATVGNEPGWQWINDMKGDAKFLDRKANRLTTLQSQINANEQALRHSGRIADMPDMTGAYAPIQSNGINGDAIKDAKIKETISAPPSVIVNTDNANKSTTVVNQGDTVQLNGKNDNAIAMALNEVTGVRNVFGYG